MPTLAVFGDGATSDGESRVPAGKWEAAMEERCP